mgnify:FL=1
MSVIYSKVAPTGLFGVEIVSSDLETWDQQPIQGRVMLLGTIDGIRIVNFEKDDTSGTWLTVDDVVFSGGESIVKLGVKVQGFYSVNLIGNHAEVGNYCDRGKVLNRIAVINGVYQTQPQLKEVG